MDHDDTKSRLVEKLCQKLQLKEPDEVAEFDGDLSVIPTKVTEISKLPVFKLKQFFFTSTIFHGLEIKINWFSEFWPFERE